jgi:branched-chain amino acid transport system ATP-binding protein
MTALLQTTALSRHFGGLQAVREVSLDVMPKTIHAILGPNGAGKTTLFNLVTGAIPPAAGSVQFEGSDVTGFTPEKLARRGIVRTFQRTSVFRQLSLRENVSLAIRSRRGLNFSVRRSRADEATVADEAQQCLRSVVVLPMPFRPSRQLTSPRRTRIDTPCRMRLLP